MKLKNYFVIFALFLLLICCASTINAVSDDDGITLDQSTEIDSVGIDENNAEPMTVSQDEPVLEKTNDDIKSEDSSSSLSPYKQFKKDIEENKGTIYLQGDISISSAFVLKEKYVIDGQGHTIDAQHKTNIFESRGGSLVLKNMVLKNGKSDYGGAIFAKGKLTIDNCKFIGNTATEAGGAVAITGGQLTITNSKFEKNTVETSKSAGYGGALWIQKSSSKISKTTFKSNKCISKKLKKHGQATKYKFNGGAIIYSMGSSHSLTECTFSNNKASNHGGAIFVFKTKSLSMKKCNFNKNRAGYEDGGAISFAGQKLTINSCNFKNNLAYEDGGAIDSYSLNSKKIKITIKKSLFQSNTGWKCGGAIWMGVKTVYKVSDTKFIKNKASSAGAVEAEDGSSQFTKCTFKSNKAAKVTSWVVKTKSGGRLAHSGGAILVKNKCKITKCTFKGNKATWGKVVKVEGGKVTAKSNKGLKVDK